MNNNFMIKIKNLILSKSEGEFWDFKQEWHRDNERLLHDILCFANTVHEKDCYIIIGVSDNGDIVGINDENRREQSSIIDLLANTVFAGDNNPRIQIDTINIEHKKVDILTIFNSNNVPYYLKSKSKKYNSIKEGYIYTRVGDRNTPINQNATIQQIEMLWKKRLGLTLPPLLQIESRLQDKTEWVDSNNCSYNIYKPEFKLVEKFIDDEYDNSRSEFYVYTQTNSKFTYKTLDIMCNETVLDTFQLVVLDSGRYKTPIPEWGHVGFDKWNVKHKYTYKYYLKDSITYKLQQFFFNAENQEEVFAKRRLDEVVLYFENQEELESFEDYIESNQSIVEQYLAKVKKNRFFVDMGNELEVQVENYRLSVGLALNKALQEFRIRK
ncbi:helix-turn-helix domain-containing protein [Bacillus thuringiensis]|uniref:ATP-binding protein n=1 Tax=Bacillus thuringiensis TaxID=1428 RepID=A0AAW4HZC3_BACTU|nr:ATP-binding protein [Bacillus thuringiensis]MBN9901126.1 ATP-binding protein [Bacillus thuringiensis]MDY7522161.1 ATP-binding protein [Bacillus thuringiensis]